VGWLLSATRQTHGVHHQEHRRTLLARGEEQRHVIDLIKGTAEEIKIIQTDKEFTKKVMNAWNY
jgi:hypothetical protein